MRRNAKHQAPEKLQASICKPGWCTYWGLLIEYSLGFGDWDLELSFLYHAARITLPCCAAHRWPRLYYERRFQHADLDARARDS